MKKGKGKSSGLLPNSLKIISSCIKTVSTNASTVVRSAGASVAASLSAAGDDQRDQVLWAGFDRLETAPASLRHVLLLGYRDGFQVIDVEDASDFTELVSKRDGPVTYLQLLPLPAKSDRHEKLILLRPLLLVVAGDEGTRSASTQNHSYLSAPGRDGSLVSQSGTSVNSPTAVRFYSLQSNCYVKVLRFRSTVFMVKCSPLIVAVGLKKEIHCIDAVTLENKFIVPTYPVPQFAGPGLTGMNFGYGPLAVGPRWLAYASNNLLLSNTGRLSPKNLIHSPVISPSSSPSNSNLMARYAMESSKQLATGIINLSDKGYKAFSKYCPEMLQERPNSPTPLNSDWKVTTASPETDTAGLVTVKDVVSKAVISQFRAHSSQLSALCFDPSGTLLVTASIHGNNINIFRIMPCNRRGSSNQSNDWSSAHVLLYKLHRGITTAIIQDISFGHNSQWISIVSSKGTCHIFALSPFGGGAGYHTNGFHDSAINPVLSLPWWSTPSFILDQQPPPPPPPLTLSVVGRIKNNSSGFLNSFSNTASSAVGKVNMPSGAVASVFHNSMTCSHQHAPITANSLEHLLVYTPSGYVIQYELLPSIVLQDVGSKTQSVSDQAIHEELTVNFVSRQWWDVCRRSDAPEREKSISATTSNDCIGGQKLVKSDSVKRNDRANWFLSNAEVQINSGRLPIWQNTKVLFYAMSSASMEGFAGGEAEIENMPFYEVKIKRRDLLPVYDHFNIIKSGWNDRANSVGKSAGASSLEAVPYREKVSDESVICHSNPASLSSTGSSDGGSSRRIENLLDMDPVNCEKFSMPIDLTLNELYLEGRGSMSSSLLNQKPEGVVPSGHYNNVSSHNDTENGRIMRAPLTTNHFDSAMEFMKKLPSESSGVRKVTDFEGCFPEAYCNVVDSDGCYKLTGGLIDYNENDESHCDRGTSENDGMDDELLGGMFNLSEEVN